METEFDIKRLIDLLMDPDPVVQQEVMELVGGLEQYAIPEPNGVGLFDIGMEQQTSTIKNAVDYIDRLIKFLMDLALQLANTNVWLYKSLDDVKKDYHNKTNLSSSGKAKITKNIAYVTINYKPQLDYIYYLDGLRKFKNVFNEIINYQANQFSRVTNELIEELKKPNNDLAIVKLIESNNIANSFTEGSYPKYVLGNREILVQAEDVRLNPLDTVGKSLELEYQTTPYTYRQVDDLTKEARQLLDLLTESTNAFKVRRIKDRFTLINKTLTRYVESTPDTQIVSRVEKYVYWNTVPINEFQRLAAKIVQAVCSTVRDLT